MIVLRKSVEIYKTEYFNIKFLIIHILIKVKVINFFFAKMSFMNPVDMVEEDAADLQFPKGKNSVHLPFILIYKRL